MARTNYALPQVVDILKSSVAAGTTTDSGWAAELAPYRSVANAFLASVAAFGAFDAIREAGAFKSVPFRTSVAVTSVTATATVLGERQTKPISKLEAYYFLPDQKLWGRSHSSWVTPPGIERLWRNFWR